MESREKIRLRILELAVENASLAPTPISCAEDFAEFVFDREPARLRVAADAITLSALGTARAKPQRTKR